VNVSNDCPARIIDRDGELWFVAKDVCKVLEIKLQANSTRYLDDDERGVCLINTPSGEQQMMRVIEVGRERFGERNDRRAGKNVAADEKGTHSMSPLKENENNSITSNDGTPRKACKAIANESDPDSQESSAEIQGFGECAETSLRWGGKIPPHHRQFQSQCGRSEFHH